MAVFNLVLVGRKKKKVRGRKMLQVYFLDCVNIPDCACLNQQSYLIKWHVMHFHVPDV